MKWPEPQTKGEHGRRKDGERNHLGNGDQHLIPLQLPKGRRGNPRPHRSTEVESLQTSAGTLLMGKAKLRDHKTEKGTPDTAAEGKGDTERTSVM